MNEYPPLDDFNEFKQIVLNIREECARVFSLEERIKFLESFWSSSNVFSNIFLHLICYHFLKKKFNKERRRKASDLIVQVLEKEDWESLLDENFKRNLLNEFYFYFGQTFSSALRKKNKKIKNFEKKLKVHFSLIDENEHIAFGAYNKVYSFSSIPFVKKNRVKRVPVDSCYFQVSDIPDSIFLIKNLVNSSCYQVMKKYAGSLRNFIGKGFLSENEKYEITFSILSAIFLLHENNIAHLDIKPENILYKEVKINDQPVLLGVLCDMDSARRFDSNYKMESRQINFAFTPKYTKDIFRVKSKNLNLKHHDFFSVLVVILELFFSEVELKNFYAYRHAIYTSFLIIEGMINGVNSSASFYEQCSSSEREKLKTEEGKQIDLDEKARLIDNRDRAIRQLIGKLPSGDLKDLLNFLLAPEDYPCTNPLELNCFDFCRDAFKALEEKENLKKERYAHLVKFNETSEMFKILPRSVQDFIYRSKKISKKLNFHKEISEEECVKWCYTAEVVLAKQQLINDQPQPDLLAIYQKTEFELLTYRQKSEIRANRVFTDIEADKVLDLVAHRIVSSGVIETISIEGYRIRVEDVLREASSSKIAQFLTYVIQNTPFKWFKKICENEVYQPILTKANLNNFLKNNEEALRKRSQVNVLQMFDFIAQQDNSLFDDETLKNGIKRYLHLPRTLNFNLNRFLKGEDDYFMSRLSLLSEFFSIRTISMHPFVFELFKPDNSATKEGADPYALIK